MNFIVINAPIVDETVMNLSEILHKEYANKQKDINVIINSFGGTINAAYKIISLLWRYTKHELSIYVLEYAKSAATFICLGASKLFLSDIAELGPMDPQIYQEKAESSEFFPVISHTKAIQICHENAVIAMDDMVKLLTRKAPNIPLNKVISHAINYANQFIKPLLEQIEPHKIAQYESFLEEAKVYAALVEEKNQHLKNLKQITEHLVKSYPSHDFVIDIDHLKTLGLKVNIIDTDKCEKIYAQIEEKKGVFGINDERGENGKKIKK